MFFRQAGPRASKLATYIEVDFAENTTKKAMAIRKSKDLSTLLGKPEDVMPGTVPNIAPSMRTHPLVSAWRYFITLTSVPPTGC